MVKGTLYLIPVVMADGAEAKSLTPFLSETINQIKEYIVENEKTARRCLKFAGLQTPQSELIIHDYGKHERGFSLKPYFEGLEKGQN
ncbi:MAG: SAM-dependent methyltransferase, partial [Pedobacter sp.]|nr:SAM-dependent methyltransferase [Pedobacter sp.]